MTKLRDLVGRNLEAPCSSEERPLRQAVLIVLFFLFWQSDKVCAQLWQLAESCGRWARRRWGRWCADAKGKEFGVSSTTFSRRFRFAWLISLVPALMYFVKEKPGGGSCWQRHNSSVLLLPLFTVLRLLLALIKFLHALVPTCLPRVARQGWERLCACVTDMTSWMTMRHLKHALSVVLLFSLMFLASFAKGPIFGSEFSAVETYGLLPSILIYLLQGIIIIPLPFFIFNFLGVTLLNVFTPRPKLQRSPLLGPFLCFRVVTRGLFPKLVNDNVKHNLKVCDSIGLHNYIFEVVTDIPINIETTKRSREIVVPKDYRTSSGSLYKARALQYALEPEVDILSPGDWIVHLDEETVLTEEAVIGIINFAGAGDHSFGQGVITYGKCKIENWITTLADSIRVGIDYGCVRFSLGILHRPVFSWKGSFIVADAQAEKDISFDHGPEASIAEDCFFACVAFSKGYSFGFVEGEMLEKSTFSLNDFVQQRRRWMHGILLTALSRKIPLRYKLGPVLMSFAACTMPINILMVPLTKVFPMPSSPFIGIAYSFIVGTLLYLFILGTLRTFCVRQYGVWRCALLVIATLLCGLIACVLENISSILVFWTPRTSVSGFYVVNKEVQNDCMKMM